MFFFQSGYVLQKLGKHKEAIDIYDAAVGLARGPRMVVAEKSEERERVKEKEKKERRE